MPGATIPMKVLVQSCTIMGAIEAMCSAASVRSTSEISEFLILELLADEESYITRAEKIKTSGPSKIMTYTEGGCCATPEEPLEPIVTIEQRFDPPKYLAA